jgi:YVTN family beta-propeller protein
MASLPEALIQGDGKGALTQINVSEGFNFRAHGVGNLVRDIDLAAVRAHGHAVRFSAVGVLPYGVAVTPDGSKVYVANLDSNNVSVIAAATNTVVTTIPVGFNPLGVAVSPDGSKVYIAM